jgi:alpha-glucosidase
MVAAFGCSTGNAQIIYFNPFNGGAATIHQTAPTVANGILGGSSSATWVCTYTNAVPFPANGTVLADGTIGTNAGCALLPFTPQPGTIYYITASLTGPASMADWVAMGLTQTSRQTNNASFTRFNDNPGPQGYEWMNAREGIADQLFGGSRTSIGAAPLVNALPSAGTYTLEILLNTFGDKWAVSAYVNGTIMGTNVVGGTQISTNLVYLVNPLIYQWYTNNVPIAGAANPTLTISPVSTSDAGTNYYVVVTNAYGALTSAVVSLTVRTNVTSNTNAPSQLTSPDGSLALTFAVSNFDGSVSCPVYGLTRHGQTLITPSKLGLTFDGGGLLRENLAVVSETNSVHDSTWQPVYAEKSSIRDQYNQLVVNLREVASPNRLLQLTFRAYNEGAAFCYTIPSQTGFAGATNLTEQTEFRFAADYPAWATYTAQGVYSRTTISGIASGCERPLPIQLATNLYLALGEARLVDYSRMKFAPLSGEPCSLVSLLDGPVTNSLPLTTPWRFIMAADNPGQLLENNFLVLNLNDPCVLTNTSRIKPGKVIRETTLKTASGMACVDFAAKHNISYIEFDAGWYGPEKTTLTATNAIGSLDLPGFINYAASKNIGVILYVNWLAMTNQLALLPPLYRGWGVRGIKYGFVSVGPQQATEIVNTAARICATNQLMMEVHDEFRPSGYTRTYPNFMTVEGILGDEGTPTTTQDTTELFSRLLVGGADHTVCYFEKRVTNHWSYACQLAKSVCCYSPWQYLYWYDRPTNSYGYVNGGNAMITEVPEMDFYDYLPAVWDETRVLQGSIGQYAIIARRTGKQWFIGAMNANSTRTFNVPLDFLTPGRKYIENVYSQDPSVPTRTHVRIDRFVVDSTATLAITLAPSRGEAVRLLPANPPAIQSLSRPTGGSFGLTIAGDVSLPYSLWTSHDLALPFTNWLLLSNGLFTNNLLSWNDSITQTQSFYRYSTP